MKENREKTFQSTSPIESLHEAEKALYFAIRAKARAEKRAEEAIGALKQCGREEHAQALERALEDEEAHTLASETAGAPFSEPVLWDLLEYYGGKDAVDRLVTNLYG